MRSFQIKVFFNGENIIEDQNKFFPFIQSFNILGIQECDIDVDLMPDEKDDFEIPPSTEVLVFAQEAQAETIFNGLRAKKEEFSISIEAPVEIGSIDWVAESHKHFQTKQITQKFMVVPSWNRESCEVPRGVHPLYLDPGSAFGTGTHPTTRGCLASLEKWIPQKKVEKVLDYGCGSGILGLGASFLGAKEISLVENDSDSLAAAKTNLELNHPDFTFQFFMDNEFQGQSMPDGTYDLLVSNIFSSVLISLKKVFYDSLKKNGILILAGLLPEQKHEVLNEFQGFGFSQVEQMSLSDNKMNWPTLVLMRESK